MAFTVTIVPGTTWSTSDTVSAAKLNLGDGGMTITVTGSSRDLSDVSTTVPTEGYMLIYRTATGKWTPEAIPTSSSDIPNRLFMWAHFM